MNDVLQEKLNKKYDAGFTTNVESVTLPPGLNEDIVTQISKIKKEPKWLLEFRLKAYQRWKILKQPDWANLNIKPIDYQAISYYSAPKPRGLSYQESVNMLVEAFYQDIKSKIVSTQIDRQGCRLTGQ